MLARPYCCYNVVPGPEITPWVPKIFFAPPLWRRKTSFVSGCQPPRPRGLAFFTVWSAHVRLIFQSSLQVPGEPTIGDLKAYLWLPGGAVDSELGVTVVTVM